nr:MAG TPA: hypothetical protein [Caudoviricetes sp.]
MSSLNICNGLYILLVGDDKYRNINIRGVGFFRHC